MSSNEIMIDVKNISKRYEIYATPRDRLKQLVLPTLRRSWSRIRTSLGLLTDKPPQYFREFWALHDLSFQVRKGDTFGIVGINGSGKSTLLQMVCSTLTPTSGSVETKGRVAALLELGSGFNPDFTGRENVFLNGQILGLRREEIQEKFQAIEEFASIGDFIDQPVKTYSSGMVVRLAFAVAIHVDPDILIVDEALAVGDIAFQRKCMRWMEEFTAKRGILLFVSHSTDQVRKLCSNAIYLRNGRLILIGNAKEVCDQYEKDLYTPNDANVIENKYVNVNSSPEISFFEDSQKEIDASVSFPDCAFHYGNELVKISDAWLADSTGARRNHFKKGESLFWCYRVQFNVDVPTPVFGFSIKTKEGIILFGTNSRILNAPIREYKSGDKTLIRFSIEPNLGVGEYFLNCGVSIDSSNISDNVEFLHRVVDAGIFTVLSNGVACTGLVNMKTSLSVYP